MDVSSINTGTTVQANRSGQAAAAPSGINSDFQTFLKMLTAQIQNQDPLNPTPSDEFAVQLATFSAVEQQVLTNDLLKSLGTQFATMGMAEFAGWVGMEGRAAVPALFRGAPITLSPNPSASADRAELVVRDAYGREVERLAVPVSAEPLQWSGRNGTGQAYPAGVYSFELVSFAGGVPVASSTVETYGEIVEARGEGGQTLLVFESGASVPASEISALRRPGGV